MKLIDLVDARGSLQKLVQQDLPIRKAYELMLMTEQANRHLGFYAAEVAKGKRVEELNEFEIRDFEKVRIEMTDDLRLSASDIALLLPIIDFYEGDEHD